MKQNILNLKLTNWTRTQTYTHTQKLISGYNNYVSVLIPWYHPKPGKVFPRSRWRALWSHQHAFHESDHLTPSSYKVEGEKKNATLNVYWISIKQIVFIHHHDSFLLLLLVGRHLDSRTLHMLLVRLEMTSCSISLKYFSTLIKKKKKTTPHKSKSSLVS